MVRKIFYHTLFCLNVIALFLGVIEIVLLGKGYGMDDLETFLFWRTQITVTVLVFWIWNIVIWARKDKRTLQLIALFFLPGIYTLFYYGVVLKRGWIRSGISAEDQ